MEKGMEERELRRWRKEPEDKQYRWCQEAGKGKETDSLSKPTDPFWTSHFQNCVLITLC